MSLNTIGLWLLVIAYSLFLIYDGCVQSHRFGKTLVAVRLRRRLADAIFLLVIIIAGIYYEWNSGKNTVNFIALILLSLLVLIHGLRYPKWRLKQEGFISGGRYWLYEAITVMRLSEDGVLVLVMSNGQNIVLPVARIEDLEKAAVFFMGKETLQHLFEQKREILK